MLQSLSKVYLHIIFSTKHRQKLIDPDIENQKEHHEYKSFQDECREFFQKYGVEYDERYVWD